MSEFNYKEFIPVHFDWGNNRENRQTHNNRTAFNTELKECVNTLQFDRLAKELQETFHGFTLKDLEEKLKNDEISRYITAFSVSKNAAKQSSKDESSFIKLSGDHLKKCMPNFEMKKLGVNDLVPVKSSGLVVSRKELNSRNIAATDTLRSFDFSGSCKNRKFYGWAKFCVSAGGVQSYAFEESNYSIEWLNNFAKEEIDYILLLDFQGGEFDSKIKELKKCVLKENVHIFNHLEFQEFFVKKYYGVNNG